MSAKDVTEDENKDKLKLKDRSTDVNVFTYIPDPDGNQVLWTRTFRSEQYVAFLE